MALCLDKCCTLEKRWYQHQCYVNRTAYFTLCYVTVRTNPGIGLTPDLPLTQRSGHAQLVLSLSKVCSTDVGVVYRLYACHVYCNCVSSASNGSPSPLCAFHCLRGPVSVSLSV